MQESMLSVTTTHLNSFVPAMGDVTVKLGSRYFTKKARDLNVGDKIVIHNENIKKTLDELIPVLEHSIRYTLARDQLFEKAEGDHSKYVPHFRAMLLRALAAGDPDLEEKILRTGGKDFSKREYTDFRGRLANYVDVTPQTLTNWLTGKSYAPEDWGNFEKLSALGSEFGEIAKSREENRGFYANYQLVVGLHRTVTSYLAKRQGKGNENEADSQRERKAKDDSKAQRGKYTQEISMITQQFFDDRDLSIDTAVVLKVKPVEKGKKGSYDPLDTAPKPKLKRGVILGRNENLPTVADFNEINNTHYIIVNAVYDVLNRYALKLQRDEPKIENALVITSCFTSYALISLFAHDPFNTKMFETNMRFITTRNGIKQEKAMSILKDTYARFNAEIRSGEIDKSYNMQYGTTANLIDVVRQYSSALPRTYKEWRGLKIEEKCTSLDVKESKSRSQRRENERKLKKIKERRSALRDYLERNYKLSRESKPFFYTFYSEDLGARGSNEIGQEKSPVDLVTIRRGYERQGMRFLTSSEVKQNLERHGIPDAFKLYVPESFIGEK